MSPSRDLSRLPDGIVPELPLTALAPMQNITDVAFLRTLAHYGPPDYFFTEYFRVHAQSRLERHILATITEHGSGRPVFAQLIGEDAAALARAARQLCAYPIAGIDLNLGCPAPQVYRKNAGGGLLRSPERVDAILGALRDAVSGRLSVKMRIGFDSTQHLDVLLGSIERHGVDLLSLHGRTVREMYFGGVHYDVIAHAVARLACPVLANGEVSCADKAFRVLEQTQAAGVMIGRHAIRNPWIFRQCRQRFSGQAVSAPTLADVREYVERLYRATAATRALDTDERAQVCKLKRYLNFIALGVDAHGAFLHAVRRAETESDLFRVCDEHLLREPDKVFADEPYPGLIARPRCEAEPQGGKPRSAAQLHFGN